MLLRHVFARRTDVPSATEPPVIPGALLGYPKDVIALIICKWNQAVLAFLSGIEICGCPIRLPRQPRNAELCNLAILGEPVIAGGPRSKIPGAFKTRDPETIASISASRTLF